MSPAARPRGFAVRFLGRPWFWVLLVIASVLSLGAWWARGLPGRERFELRGPWLRDSGVVLLVLFLSSALFSLRKWSIKLRWFRDLGRGAEGGMDALWSGLQQLNRDVASDRLTGRREIVAAARRLLVRTRTEGIRRPVLERVESEGRQVTVVSVEPREPLGRLETWLEVHASLGAVACVGSLLHADFALRSPLGWLMVAASAVVLLSGVLGLILYRVAPERLARAGFGIPYEEASVAIERYGTAITAVHRRLPDELRRQSALLLAGIGDDALRTSARELLARNAGEEGARMRDLLVLAGTRAALRSVSRRALRIDAWLRGWRIVHVPAALLLFALILVHVFAVGWF